MASKKKQKAKAASSTSTDKQVAELMRQLRLSELERVTAIAERDAMVAQSERTKQRFLCEGIPLLGKQVDRAVNPSVGSKRTQTTQQILLRRHPFGFLLPPQCLHAEAIPSCWTLPRDPETDKIDYSVEYSVQKFVDVVLGDAATILNQRTSGQDGNSGRVIIEGEHAVGELRPDFTIYSQKTNNKQRLAIGYGEVKLPLLASKYRDVEPMRRAAEESAQKWHRNQSTLKLKRVKPKEPSLTTTGGYDAMTRDRAIQQCVDYLFKLRTEFGIRHAWCLLLTGRESSVLWLEDKETNALAALSNTDIAIVHNGTNRTAEFSQHAHAHAHARVTKAVKRLCATTAAHQKLFVQQIRDQIPFADDLNLPKDTSDDLKRIIVNQSEIYKSDDPRIAAFLISVLNKMSLSPIFGAPTDLLQERRLYRMAPVVTRRPSIIRQSAASASASASAATASAPAAAQNEEEEEEGGGDETESKSADRGIFWSSLAARLTLTWFGLDPKDPLIYCLLRRMDRGGRDGEVWLACSKSGGSCCILKYRMSRNQTEEEQDGIVSIATEAKAWRDAYGSVDVTLPPEFCARAGKEPIRKVSTSAAHVRVCPSVGGVEALVMPFVYTFLDNVVDNKQNRGAASASSASASSASAAAGGSTPSYRASHVFRTIHNPDGSRTNVTNPVVPRVSMTTHVTPETTSAIEEWQEGNRKRATDVEQQHRFFAPLVSIISDSNVALTNLVSFSHQILSSTGKQDKIPTKKPKPDPEPEPEPEEGEEGEEGEEEEEEEEDDAEATDGQEVDELEEEEAVEPSDEEAEPTLMEGLLVPHENLAFDELVALELASKEYAVQAIEAAKFLLRVGILHLDPKPDHVGLMPIVVTLEEDIATKESRKGIAFLPVLIDLSAIERFDVRRIDQKTMDGYCRQLEQGLQLSRYSITLAVQSKSKPSGKFKPAGGDSKQASKDSKKNTKKHSRSHKT